MYKCDKCHNTVKAISRPNYHCFKCTCHTDNEVSDRGTLLTHNGEEKKYYDMNSKPMPVKCQKQCRGHYFETIFKALPKASGVFNQQFRYSQDRREQLNYSSYWLEGWVGKLNKKDSKPNKPVFYKQKVRIRIPDLVVYEQTTNGDWKESYPRLIKTNGNLTYGFNMLDTLIKAIVTHTKSWVKLPIIEGVTK